MKNTRDIKRAAVHLLILVETLLVILAGTFAVLLSCAISWMFETWSHLTMDELMYQLNAPFDGTNNDMIVDFAQRCVPPAALVFFLIVILLINFRKNKKIYHSIAVLFLAASVLLSAIRVSAALDLLGAENYSENQTEYTEYVNENFVNTEDVNLVFPEKKRNLIYIFLESMEITYADKANGGAYDQNYIPELTALAQENENFSGTDHALNGGYSMPSTTWTMGGMFAQTSGLPLSISQADTDEMGEEEIFMPDITALGDILEKEGYTQVLHIGSDAAFGGRQSYFTQHGGYEMKDYYYALEEGRFPSDYRVWWGYEDNRLFEYAKEELLELAEEDEPFNFTMLTADTHFEDGYVCEDCQSRYGDNQYANVIACSSKKVSEFVKWIQQQDFYENTTIVISGDHPTMDSDFCENIEGDYVRKVYTTYINSAVEPVNPDLKRDYTTFDNFPSTLASLGVTIEGEQLGLGTNLFSGSPTLTERLGRGALEGKLEADLPHAEVTVETYDENQASILVSISDFHNVRNGITDVSLAVWSKEDQSDVQWIPAVQKETDLYEVNIMLSSFEYNIGNYTMHAYLWDQEGRPWMIGDTEYKVKHVNYVEEESESTWNPDSRYTDYTGSSGYTQNTDYTGNAGTASDADNTGNTDVSSGTGSSENPDGTGDTLDTGSTQNPGSTQGIGSTQGSGNTQGTGSTQNSGNTQGTGGTQNPGGTQDTGSTQNPGNTQGTGSAGNTQSTGNTQNTTNVPISGN